VAGVRLKNSGKPHALIEDNSVRSHALTVVNAIIGYRFDNGYRLDVIDLFNSKDH
jgi:hypothetical protein